MKLTLFSGFDNGFHRIRVQIFGLHCEQRYGNAIEIILLTKYPGTWSVFSHCQTHIQTTLEKICVPVGNWNCIMGLHICTSRKCCQLGKMGIMTINFDQFAFVIGPLSKIMPLLVERN